MKSGLTFLGIGALAYPTAKPIAEKAGRLWSERRGRTFSRTPPPTAHH